MAQTIKSLQKQFEKVKVDGFSVKGFKKGDYGHNTVIGTLSNGIEVAFRIYYQRENAQAIDNICEMIKQDMSLVEYIKDNLMPKGCELVMFHDGFKLFAFKMGISVDGHIIEFYVPWVHWVVENNPPVDYTLQEVITIIKNTTKKISENFRTLLTYPKFEYESHSVVSGFTHKNAGALDVKINGSAYGVKGCFVIKNFENADVKKILKQQLKYFKRKSHNKPAEAINIIDFRDYPEIIDACEKENRLCAKYREAHDEKARNIYEGYCKDTLIPLFKKFFVAINARFINRKNKKECSWENLFLPDFFGDDICHGAGRLEILFSRGYNGQYIWANNVVTTKGCYLQEKREEFLKEKNNE